MSRFNTPRQKAALVIYWLLWAPWVILALPFALVGLLFELCAERWFPRIADFVRPAWSAGESFARFCANAVYGKAPDPTHGRRE